MKNTARAKKAKTVVTGCKKKKLANILQHQRPKKSDALLKLNRILADEI